MSNASVSAIRMPRLRDHWRGQDFSRSTLQGLLDRLKIGGLTVHEGGDSMRFGAAVGAGEPQAVVHVHDPSLYQLILTGGVVGAGEAYMLGYWSSPDLVQVIRLFSANLQTMQAIDADRSRLRRLGQWLLRRMHRNTLGGSRRNISAHYDLGNEFFQLFLDDSMMYSSAVYPFPGASLEQASRHKLDLLCRQLQLQPEDHLLEIGTGWGGMALYAASHCGCRVTTTTISRQQYEYARQRVEDAGLEERVTVLCLDYRELQGSYDKLVSIEMIEAVGHQYYGSYFSRCSDLLKPGGLMAIQAITMADQRYLSARDSVDFIKRYIFPGGCLPSVAVIGDHLARDTDMQIVHLRDISADYAETLAHWRQRFLEALPEVRQQGFDEVFERMWEFYLAYCEGGFRERIISTVQLTFAKPGFRF